MNLFDLLLEITVDTYIEELSESDLKRFMPILAGHAPTKKILMQRLENLEKK